jgi:hypothetical protein
MNINVSRRQFVRTGSLGVLGAGFLGGSAAHGQSSAAASGTDEPEDVGKIVAKTREKNGAMLEQRLVEELVFYAHHDLAKVKSIVTAQPKIVNCVIDWGGGDYETALGAAAHMGLRDMAVYLLEHQARLDIFAAAMLGMLDIVKAAIAAFPDIANVPGPHGIPLLVHAEMGGDDARPVLEFLQSATAK